MSKKHDPELYRRMSAPFESSTAANDALQAFFAEVDAAREKHRISDVMVLTEVAVITDGEETRGAARNFRGCRSNILPMLARVYGEERQSHEDDLALLMAHARKRAK